MDVELNVSMSCMMIVISQEDQGELAAAQGRLARAAVLPGGAAAPLQVTNHNT